MLQLSTTPAPDEPLKIALFGGGFDTANLGVAALTESVIQGLKRRIADVEITVYDHTSGTGTAQLGGPNGGTFRRAGARWSKRFYRNDSLWNLDFSSRFSGLVNPIAKRLLDSDAVLDISGGDSFTDLYGEGRYEYVLQPKRIALRQGLPLILLPQTYGPFGTAKAEASAAELVKASAEAWARDARSFEILKQLTGDSFDATRHRRGTDVAFSLQPYRPANLNPELEAILDDRATPIIGFNISGLIYNDPERARKSFGFKADYNKLVVRCVRRLLEESDARVLLVSHVLPPPGHFESDRAACEAVVEQLPSELRKRVSVLPTQFEAGEIKWVIGRCDWFCGTRMHATIAALSSGVPTATISYSPKALGIFEDCASSENVADPKQLDTDAAAEIIWGAWQRREASKAALAEALVEVKRVAEAQMDSIAATCERTARAASA